MKLLAIDTSSASTIVAAADGERVALRRHDPAPGERPAHTTAALTLAAEALGELGLAWTALECVGVGIGPGSFTGLRSGLSAAAGVARRLDLPLVGVTTTALVAHAGQAKHPGERVLAVVDGRRKELFVQAFDARGAAASDDDAPVPAGITVARRSAVDGLGDLSGWVVVGDGAALERDAFLERGADVPALDSPLHGLSGASLAALTAAGEGHPADEVRPAYGREPDAVPTASRPVKPIPGGATPAAAADGARS